MLREQVLKSDKWLDRKGPEEHVAISSRARYARNLPHLPFPARSGSVELSTVVEHIGHAISQSGQFRDGLVFNLSEIPSKLRHFLKENHLISRELEKGGAHRLIFINEQISSAIMVNEEDHFRLYAIEPGLQLPSVLNNLIELESAIEQYVTFAFSPRYGYLSACPTNTGTGLRASVLLHLPALSTNRRLAQILKSLPEKGLTIRGPYGENSESFGDLFQISNEVTLGKNENDIVSVLSGTVEELIAAEEETRYELTAANKAETEDQIWRSWGVLTNARMISSSEAIQNLSKLRLGIDQGWFPGLTHNILNKLIVRVQPGHVQLYHSDSQDGTRDLLRANMLRRSLTTC